jgi:hypothetical protein
MAGSGIRRVVTLNWWPATSRDRSVDTIRVGQRRRFQREKMRAAILAGFWSGRLIAGWSICVEG